MSKAFNEFDITVCENNIDDVFDAFKLLHIEIAGRETRSNESWDIQKQQIVIEGLGVGVIRNSNLGL